MLKMKIMRGLPGSGKSTIANILATSIDAIIASADNYFMRDGIYKFNRFGLGAAHEFCYETAKKALVCGRSVIIDNTNTTHREYDKYLDLAVEYGADVEIITVPWKEEDIPALVLRNTHGVPEESIRKMAERWQE